LPWREQLQRDYLDQGSAGLKHFARIRNITGTRIASALAERRFTAGRRSCCGLSARRAPRRSREGEIGLRTIGYLRTFAFAAIHFRQVKFRIHTYDKVPAQLACDKA
jgi:hypothetical protein